MNRVVILLTLVGALLRPAASSAISLFTDRASWEASVVTFNDVDIAGQVAEFATLPAGANLNLPSGGTVSFNTDLEGFRVPTSWATWSGGNQPAVLYTLGSSSVTGTFSASETAFGLEMEPNPFASFQMTLTLDDGSVITQTVSGSAGADFFGWDGGSVAAMNMSCVGCDFAFGRMVEGEAAPIPEPASLLLLGSGLAGLAAYRRRKQRAS
jgi:hypothetical protein